MMSTETEAAIQTEEPGVVQRTTGGSGLVPYRLTVRPFERMIDAGVFRDEDHVELLGGLLVDEMVKNEPHSFSVDQLGAVYRDVRSRVSRERDGGLP